MLKILSDRHQADLAWSLQLLADRLGATLYFPRGMEWFDKGYFRMYGDLKRKDPYRWLAKQYLEDTIFDINGQTITLETYQGCKDYPHLNFITLNEARKIPFDVVLCSINENESSFARLSEFYPNAKFVRQVGNQLDMNVNDELYPNLLSSATAPYKVFRKHKVLYMQEFDLRLFKYEPVFNFSNIYSFQNGLNWDEDAWDIWVNLQHNLSNFTFKSYGVGNDDGKIFVKKEYIRKMQEASFIFQRKFSEGYGHVVFNAFCLGRPMILNAESYLDAIAGPLLLDEETCLFIEKQHDKMIDKIVKWSDPEKLKYLSENARSMFEKKVNFDLEFIEIKRFFYELI